VITDKPFLDSHHDTDGSQISCSIVRIVISIVIVSLWDNRINYKVELTIYEYKNDVWIV